MERNTVDIHGVAFDNVTREEAIARAAMLMEAPGCAAVYTPNPEIVQACNEGRLPFAVLQEAELVVPDGIGIIYASKILKRPLKEKVAGIELGEAMIAHCAEKGYGVYLLGAAPACGASPSVADQAAENLCKKYPALSIVGTHDGYFSPEEEEAMVAAINQSGAKLLLVCLGCPKQELFIHRYKAKLLPGLAMGLGGSLDVFAGKANRAPKFFLKLNLEWLYRLLKQPSRLGRMMKLPKFLWASMKLRRKEKKQARA